jgi:hypothetical protein
VPFNPSLKHLRNEAREILKAHKAGNASCCRVLRDLRQFKDKPDEELLKTEVGLQEVQFALAMKYGFESWAACICRGIQSRGGGMRRMTSSSFMRGNSNALSWPYWARFPFDLPLHGALH